MKKTIYVLLTIVLALEISFILHGLIEIFYIDYALASKILLDDTLFLGRFYCVLPLWLSYGLLLSAVIGGYFLGQFWWRMVYIEKRHWHNWRKK
jgi:hypothetical protein